MFSSMVHIVEEYKTVQDIVSMFIELIISVVSKKYSHNNKY